MLPFNTHPLPLRHLYPAPSLPGQNRSSMLSSLAILDREWAGPPLTSPGVMGPFGSPVLGDGLQPHKGEERTQLVSK